MTIVPGPRPHVRRRRLAVWTGMLVMLLGLLVPGGGSATAQAALDMRIVTFDAPPTTTQLDALRDVAAGVHGYEHVAAAAVMLDPLDVGLLGVIDGVVDVFENQSMTPLLRQSTRTIRADEVWAGGMTGEDIGIAIIDTGIDGTHPDLCAEAAYCAGTPVKTVQNVKILGREPVADPVVVVEDQLNTDTSSGHGTHVAGIAGGAGVASEVGDDYRGVAPGADLIGLGTGEAIEAVNVLAAFDWVIEHADEYNIKVVNNSWGPGAGAPHDPGHPVNLAIAAATDAGISVVFGAGNDGPVTDTMNAFSIDPHAISVAGGTKEGHIAFFSSRGIPGSDLWRPDVTAPGYFIAAPRSSTGFVGSIADLLAPNPDPVAPQDVARYVSNSGTSMASPHVAGVIALVQQAAHDGLGRYLTPDEVRSVLQHTAVSDDPARGPGGQPNYQAYTMGAGYVDALAAVEAAAAGEHLDGWDDGVVTDVEAFAGTVGPAAAFPIQTFESLIQVVDGAISLNVMADWTVVANDIDLDLRRPDGSLALSTFLRCAPDQEPNGFSSFCSQIANERLTVAAPVPGTWRVVVRGGLASTVEDVTGLWSVDYPDGTPLPPSVGTTTIDLTAAPAATAPVDTEVTITAALTDDTGAPVPGATLDWASSGVGALVAAEATTDAQGRATATVTSATTGAQTVEVTAGDADEGIEITWVGVEPPEAPDASSPGRVRGSGQFVDDGGRVKVTIRATLRPNASTPKVKLRVRGADRIVVAKHADLLAVEATTALLSGPARVDGQRGFRYQVVVDDGGSPGRGTDDVAVVVTDPSRPLWRLELAGTLDRGNLRVVDTGT